MLINEVIVDPNELMVDRTEIVDQIDAGIAKYIEIIKIKASDALTDMSNTRRFLYRGIKTGPDVFVGRPRIDRQSRDTAPEIQEIIDTHLDFLGYLALRRNSLFCAGYDITGGPDAALSLYGIPYYIFPFDGFKYTWSSKIKDITDIFGNGMYGANPYLVDKLDHMQPKEFEAKYAFHDDDFAGALQSGCEIYINGQYAAICCGSIDRLSLARRLGIWSE